MSHYKYLDRVMPEVCENANVKGGWEWNAGLVGAHGDKGYCYRDYWEKHNIPFAQGMAVYLLSYCAPYASEVRNEPDDWVDPKQWVVDNFDRFVDILPEVLPEEL